MAEDTLSGIDRQRAEAAWQAHRRWVAAVLLAHKPREAEVEDLLQEVAVRLVRHPSLVDDPPALRAWLRTVAVNVARTAGRRARVRRASGPARLARARGEDGSSGDGPEVVDGHEEGAVVLEAARSLPVEYREPLMLRAVRGLSYKQIGDVLDLPVTTVETRLTRARRMVREELERRGVLERGGAEQEAAS